MIRIDEADPAALRQAIEAISAGHVVAFPTDTAYGLGVLPDSASAVDRVYALKGRPRSLPLILLAADMDDFAGWAELPEAARPLASRWWPGPLTLVVPAGPRTPKFLRAADGTVGIRIPAHPMARRLLAETGPLATTSANRSGSASPRNADDVVAAFGGEDGGENEPAILLDGGHTRYEADSTVLALSPAPRILRQGAVSREELAEVLSGLAGA